MTDPRIVWPHGVKPIEVDDLRRLGIGKDDQLFWDGRRIEIRRPLVLTGVQKSFAVIVTIFAILGGFGGFVTGMQNGSLYFCAREAPLG